MDKKQQAILDAVNTLIKHSLSNLKFNYYIDGVITEVLNNNIYNVRSTSGDIIKNIPARTGFVGVVNDIVQICVINGDFSRKFIDDKRLC